MSDNQNETITRFYHLAMRDIINGEPLDELEKAIRVYEETENYEACAGIKMAIDEAKNSTIINLEHGHKNKK
jgi:hypothetical protein